MDPNYFHSVVLKPDRCIGCTYCLKICPTEAIRIKNGKASIIKERCIDCGECIRVCPNHAKNAITDSMDIIKKYKYSVALVPPVLYSQFNYEISPARILQSVKSLGFDEVYDTSLGSEISAIVGNHIIGGNCEKPVINSSCPAILRLIQVRFPELLDNIMDVETPAEITARLVKNDIKKNKGIPEEDIGIIFIAPCTASVTSIKNPLGITYSCMDGAISIRDIYGSLLKKLSSHQGKSDGILNPASGEFMWYTPRDHSAVCDSENTLMVDGIGNVISVLEEIELGKLDNLSFIELAACPEGCIGGPLVVENRYVALNNLRKLSKRFGRFQMTDELKKRYISMYENGSIRFTEKIEPGTSVMSLDTDIEKSIEKMDKMRNIISDLPGLNCGICGSPTCQAFAEDIVTGNRSDSICPVSIMEKLKKSNSK